MTTTHLPTEEEVLLALQVEREAEARKAEVRAARAQVYADRDARIAAEAQAARVRTVATDPARIAAMELRDIAGDRFSGFAQMLDRADLKRFAAVVADLLSQDQGQARNAAIHQGRRDGEPERKQRRVQTDAQAVLASLGLEE